MKDIIKYREFISKERRLHNKKDDDVKLTKTQVEELVGYTNYFFTENYSNVTMKTILIHLKNFGYFLKKDFKNATKQDIKNYLNEKKDLKPTSYATIKLRIKVFYKWLNGIEEKGKYPEIVDWIKIPIIEPPEIGQHELISTKETRDILIPACHNFKDKALISIMRETGARINEILGANVKDIRMESDRGFIKLKNSKRRHNINNLYREIVLIDSFYYLEQWLRDHSLKKEFNTKKEIPLFINKKNNRFAYHDVTRLLKKLKKETNFKKKINPHSFRHAQITDMTKILTDAELRVFGGWVKSSQVIGRYTHLTSDDVNKKRLQLIGRIKDEDKEKNLELLKPCPRCNEMIDINKFIFCGRCGMNLQKEEEIKTTTKMQDLENKIGLLFKKFKEQERKKIMEEIKKK